MRLSAMKAIVRTVELTVPGSDGEPDESVWIKYKPGELTLETADRLQELVEQGKDREVLTTMLVPVLEGWDLQDDDGTELKITEDVLRTVPIQFLGQIVTALTDDARPNPPKAALSVVT